VSEARVYGQIILFLMMTSGRKEAGKNQEKNLRSDTRVKVNVLNFSPTQWPSRNVMHKSMLRCRTLLTETRQGSHRSTQEYSPKKAKRVVRFLADARPSSPFITT